MVGRILRKLSLPTIKKSWGNSRPKEEDMTQEPGKSSLDLLELDLGESFEESMREVEVEVEVEVEAGMTETKTDEAAMASAKSSPQAKEHSQFPPQEAPAPAPAPATAPASPVEMVGTTESPALPPSAGNVPQEQQEQSNPHGDITPQYIFDDSDDDEPTIVIESFRAGYVPPENKERFSHYVNSAGRARAALSTSTTRPVFGPERPPVRPDPPSTPNHQSLSATRHSSTGTPSITVTRPVLGPERPPVIARYPDNGASGSKQEQRAKPDPSTPHNQSLSASKYSSTATASTSFGASRYSFTATASTSFTRNVQTSATLPRTFRGIPRPDSPTIHPGALFGTGKAKDEEQGGGADKISMSPLSLTSSPRPLFSPTPDRSTHRDSGGAQQHLQPPRALADRPLISSSPSNPENVPAHLAGLRRPAQPQTPPPASGNGEPNMTSRWSPDTPENNLSLSKMFKGLRKPNKEPGAAGPSLSSSSSQSVSVPNWQIRKKKSDILAKKGKGKEKATEEDDEDKEPEDDMETSQGKGKDTFYGTGRAMNLGL